MALKNEIIDHIGQYLALVGVLLIEIDSALFLLALMVFTETFLGTKIALQKDSFTWRQFFRSFTKVVWFGLGLFTAAIANRFELISIVDWVHITAGFCAAYELKQIWSKVDVLAGTNIAETIREILDSRILNITRKPKKNEEPKK